MQRFTFFVSSLAIFLLPMSQASAQTGGLASPGGGGGRFQDLLGNILAFTNDVLIPFIIGIGFLVFVWGMFQYFIAGGANDESKEKGKSLMIYATLGFVLILIFWGVVNLLATSTGATNENINTLIPVVKVTP